MSTNAHGLNRTIPEGIKREVRQRCGFGCVRCGSAFIQYDHLDPPFADATEHAAAGIVLLCGSCHDQKSRGLLSVASVTAAAQNPFAFREGFSFGALDIGPNAPVIAVGELTCRNVASLIEIEGVSVFSIREPEAAGAPYRVSAVLTDEAGAEILRIVDNEMRPTATNWDVTVIGTRLTIRRAQGDVALVLRSVPPGELIVERLAMQFRGTRIDVREGHPTDIVTQGGQHLRVQEVELFGCAAGVVVSGDRLIVGKGGGIVSIGSMSLNPAGPRPPSSGSLPDMGRIYPLLHGLPFQASVRCWCGQRRVFADCCMPKLLRVPPFN